MRTEVQSAHRRRRRRHHDPRQLQFLSMLDQVELVDVPVEPSRATASHDLDQKLRRWLNEAISRSPLDRAQIAEAMTVLAGRQITKPMLDTWTGAARPNRFPADLLPAFCLAIGNNHVMEKLAADMGARLSDTQEARLARMGQWALLIAYGQEEQRRIAAALPPLPLLREAAR